MRESLVARTLRLVYGQSALCLGIRSGHSCLDGSVARTEQYRLADYVSYATVLWSLCGRVLSAVRPATPKKQRNRPRATPIPVYRDPSTVARVPHSEYRYGGGGARKGGGEMREKKTTNSRGISRSHLHRPPSCNGARQSKCFRQTPVRTPSGHCRRRMAPAGWTQTTDTASRRP